MKKLILFIILLIFISSAAYSLSDEANQFDIQIKNLYLHPDINSAVVFDIPIDVHLLAVSPDLRWAKVKIGFNFLGRHDYVGWAKLK